MIATGQRIFFQFPGESSASRILHPGSITEAQDGGYMALMDGSDLPASAGDNAFVYFEQRREFMQQPIAIDAVFTSADLEAPTASHVESDSYPSPFGDEPQVDATVETLDDSTMRVIVGFHPTGEPVSAESRQCYRVLTSISSDVSAVIDGQHNCPVLDVSATGFSIMSEAPLRQGQVVRVTLNHEQNDYAGSAVVQSSKELNDGRYRYGLYCAGDEKSNGSLFKGLQQIGTKIQREQIRRLNGAA